MSRPIYPAGDDWAVAKIVENQHPQIGLLPGLVVRAVISASRLVEANALLRQEAAQARDELEEQKKILTQLRSEFLARFTKPASEGTY